MKDENEVSIITLKIDSDLKEKVETLFDKLGICIHEACNLFLKECILRQELPFVEVPNEKLISAMKEADDTEKGKINAKKYKSFDNVLDDIENE